MNTPSVRFSSASEVLNTVQICMAGLWRMDWPQVRDLLRRLPFQALYTRGLCCFPRASDRKIAGLVGIFAVLLGGSSVQTQLLSHSAR